MFKFMFHKCAVPEKIHTPAPHGRSSEIPRGRGVLNVKILEAKYKAKLEFHRGSRGAKQKTFRGGSMEMFLNCTMYLHIQNKLLYSIGCM